MMPPQLARAKRPKRSEPRPLAEYLPQINVNDLDVPRDHKTYIANLSLRYGFISGMKINWNMVQFFHNNRAQTFRLKRIATGLGGIYKPRHAFICECGRPVIKLYFRHANLACRRCCNATYASRALGKRTRPALQDIRLRRFLEFKTYMSKRNRQRLQAHLFNKPLELASKRINNKAKLPQSNYSTRGAMHRC